MRLIDLSGQRFGRLVVLARTTTGERHTAWKCRCDCGRERVVFADALRGGRTSSCGCLRSEITSSRTRTHGHAAGPRGARRRSREYRAWLGAKERCYNPKIERFPEYGGRGIRVADAWRESFETFLRDMGPCPAGCSLDRSDVNGDYTPANCRWATDAEQRRNRRDNRIVDLNGERMILADCAKRLGMTTKQLHGALKRATIEEIAARRSTA